jgi:type VI secretion system protein ImpM
MPEPDLSVGFFGKLPSTGDFVTRGLPQAFVAPWDRWLTRHLVGRLTPRSPPLAFHRPGSPAAAGVIVPSHDSAGRSFPLTLAAAWSSPASQSDLSKFSAVDQLFYRRFTVKRPALDWLTALTNLGQTATREGLPPDLLAARLAAIAVLDTPWPARFLLWTDPADLRGADPDAPGPVLNALLGAPAEAG